MIRVTTIYDNESLRSDLQSDWGYSCLIEAYGKRILFDTGTQGSLLLANMRALGIAPASIDEVFLSHVHFDHIGGLGAFLGENGRVKVVAPGTLRGIRPATEVVYIEEKARELDAHTHTTGILGGIEQSLIIEDQQGVVLIVGCSHPGVGRILEAAGEIGRPHTLIGGLHGFDELDILAPLRLVCPTHCTQPADEIRARFPEKCVRGGAGAIIEV